MINVKNDTMKQFLNLTNKEVISDNLTFYALYLLIFENFKNLVVANVKNLLCDFKINNGKIEYIETPKWLELKEKKHKGKKNIFLSVISWFNENDAISDSEVNIILTARDYRNDIGHELLKLIAYDLCNDIVSNFAELIHVFNKIDNWWINNIEIPIAGEEIPEEYDSNSVFSSNKLIIDMIIDTIYGTKEYKKIIDSMNDKTKV